MSSGADVLEHAARLRGDVAVDDRAGGGIERDLAGDEQQLAGAKRRRVRADRPSARPGLETACFFTSITTVYAALTTLFDRRQRVQTRIRLMPPLIIARTV